MSSEVTDEPIHSGHFMTSNPHSDELLPDEEVVEVVDTDDVIEEMEDCEQKEDSRDDLNVPDEKPVTFYKFGPKKTQSIAIDVSLNKLNKCIKVAYNKMTTPKWKDFRGLRLHWKQRIRLNNVIWRAFYMEFRRPDKDKKKTPYCYFSVPDGNTTHARLEGTVLEGMYWKRGMETLKSQYKRWRHFKMKPRGRRRGLSCGFDGKQNVHISFTNQTPKTYSSEAFDLDDLNNEFTDSLFANLMQPYTFPNPKDIAAGCSADVMQPGLLSLQPSIEEIMASFDPPDPSPQSSTITRTVVTTAAPTAAIIRSPMVPYELKEFESSFAVYNSQMNQQPTRQSSSISPQILLANSSAPTYSQADYEQTPLVIATQRYSDASFDYLPQFLSAGNNHNQSVSPINCSSSSSGSSGSGGGVLNSRSWWLNITPTSRTQTMDDHQAIGSRSVGAIRATSDARIPTTVTSTLTSLGLLPRTAPATPQSAFSIAAGDATRLSQRFSATNSCIVSASQVANQSRANSHGGSDAGCVNVASPLAPTLISSTTAATDSETAAPTQLSQFKRENMQIPSPIARAKTALDAAAIASAANSLVANRIHGMRKRSAHLDARTSHQLATADDRSQWKRIESNSNDSKLSPFMGDERTAIWQQMPSIYSPTYHHHHHASADGSVALVARTEHGDDSTRRKIPRLTLTPEAASTTGCTSLAGRVAPDSTIEPLERKRMRHISAEQYRRMALRDGFDSLVALLPPARNGVKMTNASILSLSVENLVNMRNESSHVNEFIRKRRTHMEELKTKVNVLQASLSPRSTLNSESFHLNLVRQVYALVRNRAADDYRYLLNFLFMKPLCDKLLLIMSSVPLVDVEGVITNCNTWAHQNVTCQALRPLATRFIVKLATDLKSKSYPNGLQDLIKTQLENLDRCETNQ